jgi:hypothetical protein
MTFSALGKIREKVSDVTTQKAVEVMSDVNVILAALPDAGYQVGALDLELGATTPKLTVEIKVGQAIRQDKIAAALDANPNNLLLSAALNALMQASNVQQAISADTIELKTVKIALGTPPTVTVQWKEKAAAKTVAA